MQHCDGLREIAMKNDHHIIGFFGLQTHTTAHTTLKVSCCMSHILCTTCKTVIRTKRNLRKTAMDQVNSVEAFKEALLVKLKESGDLERITADLRAASFRATRPDAAKAAPQTSPETYVISQLIKEFMESCGMWASCSVFEAEAGLEGQAPIGRDALAAEVGVDPSRAAADVPLLYEVLKQTRRSGEASASRAVPSSIPGTRSAPAPRQIDARPENVIRLSFPGK